MGMISRILMVLTMCVIIVAGCGKTAGDRIDFGETQVVSIICEKQRGSGVIYEVTDDRVVIVTAAHVVENAETTEIVWNAESGSTASKPTKISKIAGLDLAFLTVEGASAESAVGSSGAADCEMGMRLALQGYDAEGVYIAAEGQLMDPWIYTEDFGSHMMIA